MIFMILLIGIGCCMLVKVFNKKKEFLVDLNDFFELQYEEQDEDEEVD